MTTVPSLHFGFGRKLPVIIQSEYAECGLACLAMIAGYFGYRTDLRTLRQRFSVSPKGLTLKNLIEFAAMLNLSARPLRLEIESLPRLKTPCILHWDLNHFVVLKRVLPRNSGIVIHDPGRGEVKIPASEVSAKFTGVALELMPTSRFVKKVEKSQRLRIREMLGSVVGLKRSFIQVFLLAVSLEVFALVSPFLMQWVVDGAIISSDRDLLNLLALGFGVLLAIQTGISFIRSWVVLYISTHLNTHWESSVFSHLLRLPASFFEKRHLGDITSRASSVQEIQRLLATSFIEAIIDGLMAMATLGMMLVYSWKLTLVVLASVVIYALLRAVAYWPLRNASEEKTVLTAKAHSLFLESIRGIQSIKLFNHENERRNIWLNSLVDATNRHIAQEKINILFKTTHILIAGIENLLIVWMGSRLVMENLFSVGMLFAFASYKLSFTNRTYSLIDKVVDFKMLSIQTDRLSEIMLSEPEISESIADGINDERIGSIGKPVRLPDSITVEARNISFRYSDAEPWVIRNLNLKISPGESVAIVGPSGCGKTTLVKILLGILQPSEGEVLVGGTTLDRIGLRNYRAMLGTVMQEDNLFSGSIIDNISFFDANMNMEWVISCAKFAAIHDEIEAMPMGYQTLIGDMGTALSGGQKQRLMLARALYKRPQILFLDEATSHLDVDRESEVNIAVKSLSLTRIIVAHRPETIRAAGRIVELSGGEVIRDLRSEPINQKECEPS